MIRVIDHSIEQDEYEMNEENASKNYYITIYEQYWEHARHVETERLSFTEIYSILVGGILAFLAVQIERNLFQEILANIFLFILTIMGYSLVLGSNIEVVIFSRLTEQIAVCYWGIPKQDLRWDTESKVRKRKQIYVADVFIFFYSLMASLFVAMLCYQVGCIFITSEIISIITTLILTLITFLTLILLYNCYPKRDIVNVISEIVNAIEKCRKKGSSTSI